MGNLLLFRTFFLVLISSILGTFGQSEGDVRLVGGSTNLDGRVEVYYGNEWGTICDQGWDPIDSDVVCRQLGFQVSLGNFMNSPGVPTQRIWLANVQCDVTDTHINQCVTPGQWGMTTTCAHAKDVGIRCSGLNTAIAPNYRGCYMFEDSPLTQSTVQFASNTIEDCLESCSTKMYTFAGLYGAHCSCDNSINPTAMAVGDAMCTTPCPGNAQQICGSSVTNMEFLSIYEVSVGNGYVASPWFPGNYVASNTDTSQSASFENTTNVNTPTGKLLIQVLAFDLAPGDTLSLDVGGTMTNITMPGELMRSGLHATTEVTASFTRAARSAGSSGYLIMFGDPPTTTMPPTSPITTPAPTTNPPATPPQTVATPSATDSQSPGMATGNQSPVLVTTSAGATDAAAPVATTPAAAVCEHPVAVRGNITTADSGPYRVGQTVVLDCNDGLQPSENTDLECQADGTWMPPPACTDAGLTVGMVVVIAVVVALVLIILIIIFLICAVSFGRRDKRDHDDLRPITHLTTPGDNDYTSRPPLIPINEESARGLVRQGTNISRASTVPDQPPPALPRSNDAVQQTEPITPPPTSEPAPDPPSPTESYPPRDYPGAGNRTSVISNGVAPPSNGHVNHLGNEERQAVDELFNAVRDYDDSPSPGLYGSVPPRHLRTGSTLSLISNPGRVTDDRTGSRYSGNRAVQFDKQRFDYRP